MLYRIFKETQITLSDEANSDRVIFIKKNLLYLNRKHDNIYKRKFVGDKK